MPDVQPNTPLPVDADLHRLVKASEQLRTEIAAIGAELDASGRDPAVELQQAADLGLNRISVPQSYGGLSDGSGSFGAMAAMRIIVNLAAGDGAVAQNWTTTQFIARQLFDPQSALPSKTLTILADRVLKGARLVASNAETDGSGPVVATRVVGGVRICGTKTFNSNSGGQGFANVSARLDGKTRHAIIPLDSPDIVQHHDWDNIGQRGTYSQTITYNDVFVPDGWHYEGYFPPADRKFFPFIFLMHPALMLGIGQGAFDAALGYLRTQNRVILSEFKTPMEDPMVRFHIGEMSIRLRSAQALLMDVARRLEDPGDTDAADIGMDVFRSKVACVQASLFAADQLFELTGTRSTASKYRYDRFWRNARVFSVHDSTDAKILAVGGWELDGVPAPMFRG